MTPARINFGACPHSTFTCSTLLSLCHVNSAQRRQISLVQAVEMRLGGETLQNSGSRPDSPGDNSHAVWRLGIGGPVMPIIPRSIVRSQ